MATSDLYLTIDHGNSGAKYVLWEGGEIAGMTASAVLSAEVVTSLAAGRRLRGIILGSVADTDGDAVDAIARLADRMIILTADTPMPIDIDYGSRSTLGVDRIAAAAGAAGLFGRREMIVVDAGTAITIDHVDASGTFRGGNIAPGLTMQLEALHRFTARLPQVEYPENAPEWDGRFFGSDTASAITLGAIVAMAGAVEYCRRRLGGDTLVVLTGGSAPLLARHIDGEVEVFPRLVDTGLYRILLYNENN